MLNRCCLEILKWDAHILQFILSRAVAYHQDALSKVVCVLLSLKHPKKAARIIESGSFVL